MKIKGEYAVKIEPWNKVIFSCFFQEKQIQYGLTLKNKIIYIFSNKTRNLIELPRYYQKMLYNPITHGFFAYYFRPNRNEIWIYFLDEFFQEVDYLLIKERRLLSPLQDFWFDKEESLFYLLFNHKIKRYNCNGDYLGGFMAAPFATHYQALCMYQNKVYVAYTKNRCVYLAVYTKKGTFKERLCIGESYVIGNMQVILIDNCPILRLYAVKKYTIPLLLEIDISQTLRLSTPTIVKFPPCLLKNSEKLQQTEQKNLQIELVHSEGIGTITCHTDKVK